MSPWLLKLYGINSKSLLSFNIYFCIDITFGILNFAYSADILHIIHVIIDAILFFRYMIFSNMHAPLVIIFSEIYNLQLGIAGRRRTAMRLPNNITKCTILKLYEYV